MGSKGHRGDNTSKRSAPHLVALPDQREDIGKAYMQPSFSCAAQSLSLTYCLPSSTRKISSMSDRGYSLTAMAGNEGNLFSAFTKDSDADELTVIDVAQADPGISHAYRLGTSTLRHVCHNGKSWIFAYVPKRRYLSQSVVKAERLEVLLHQIRLLWKRDFRVTSVAYGQGHWVAVATHSSDLKEQIFFTASDAGSLQEKTKSAWDEGRRITAITYGEGKWLVFLDKETNGPTQKWITRRSFTDLRAKIREEWPRGFQVSSLARGAGVWLVVLSRPATS